MGKGHFNFKQFTIYQDQCGMKVCTDSCLFGALIDVTYAKRILDIGTGTGLLSLMMAQRSSAKITAIEPDESAYTQSLENVKRSPFDNIEVLKLTLQDYVNEGSPLLDLIVCNPPFYSNYVKSSDQRYNSAIHSSDLPFAVLIDSIDKLLTKQGNFWLLLPTLEFQKCQALAEQRGIYLKRKFIVFDSPTSKPIRTIGVFTKNFSIPSNTEIYIKNANNTYSQQFRSLLTDYYTIF